MDRGASKKLLVERRLGELNPAIVDEVLWRQFKSDFAPVSDSYLRNILRDSKYPLAPVVEGVSTTRPDAAERVLRALSAEYLEGDLNRRKVCRDAVLEAKQKLKWKLGKSRPNEDHAEIFLWVSTWLENPALFPEWLTVRHHYLGRVQATSSES